MQFPKKKREGESGQTKRPVDFRSYRAFKAERSNEMPANLVKRGVVKEQMRMRTREFDPGS